MAITLFSRGDPSSVRNDELMLLFAAVNKIKVSPVKAMISQWISYIKMLGPISCTSLITRIADMVKALEGNNVSYIQEPRPIINDVYLIQGHILKRGPNDTLIYFFPGFANELSLPNQEIHLYTCPSLLYPLVPQEEARRSTCSGLPGKVTRSRARRAAEQAPLPQEPPVVQQMQQAGWVPTPPPYSAWEGVSYFRPTTSWQTGDSQEWAQGTYRILTPNLSASSSSRGPPVGGVRRSTSTRDFTYLTQQLGELNIRHNTMEETLNQHVQETCSRFDTLEQLQYNIQQAQQQQRDEMMAYFRSTGYNPHQQQ